MSLYEDWIKMAYNKDGQSEKALWDKYIPLEQKIYENIIKNKANSLKGTVKELGARFSMPVEYVCGFIDGINDASKEPIKMEELEEDQYVSLDIDFEKLFKKMVEYKAEHLYSLSEWKEHFSEERQKELYYEQKKSGTVVKEQKLGRNDLCSCGSGKKYKRCCGTN